MGKNAYIDALNKAGQQVWYDNLSRQVLASGELRNLIASGVTGLTSNPTIFKKAIADTKDYDHDIAAFAHSTPGEDAHSTAEEICEDIMLQDISAAADLLKPVYDQSEGTDGFVSVEVPPYLAKDSTSTIVAARRLWTEVRRPNLMIKIPGTREGLPAIYEALTEGINVNVTLLFSVEAYKQVVEQYFRALETRHKQGKPLSSVASVASFFVSRVDTIVERELLRVGKERGGLSESTKSRILGKAGIANTRLAYVAFKELFGSARFDSLRAHGARLQKPLWASTGVKSPVLPGLLYVEELALPHTVTSLPPATISLLLRSAVGSLHSVESLELSSDVFPALSDEGIGIEALLDELLASGLEAFSTSYRELLAAVEAKLSGPN